MVDQVTTLADPVTGEILVQGVFPKEDELMVAWMAEANEEAANATIWKGKCELELMRRAAERGATTIYGKGQNFVVTKEPIVDRTQLHPLLELLDPAAGKECFIPAHTATVDVPDKWDMVKVKKHARARGNEALTIVEAATYPGKATGKLVATESK